MMDDLVTIEEMRMMCQICFGEGENNGLRIALKKETIGFDDYFKRILELVTIYEP